jgi:hypothetical protein
MMLGRRINYYWIGTWKIVAPIIIVVGIKTFVFCIGNEIIDMSGEHELIYFNCDQLTSCGAWYLVKSVATVQVTNYQVEYIILMVIYNLPVGYEKSKEIPNVSMSIPHEYLPETFHAN